MTTCATCRERRDDVRWTGAVGQCLDCAPAPPAHLDHGEAAALAARFTTAVDLKARAPERVPWVWEGYLARGAVTLLAGKPKAGKTTITADLIEAVASGVSFLGRPVTGGSVVLVCEESSVTLADKLVARRNVHVLARDDCWPKPSWPILVAAASLRAEQVEAVLVVVDSLSFWAALGADREKDAGATQTALEPLQEAARDRAVLLAHHQRKGGGGEGEAIRGSSAIAGAVDVIVEYERPAGEGIPETQRQLVAVGRFTTTPPLLLVDRDRSTGAWRVIGEGDARGDAERIGFRERILGALPVSPPGITQEDIAETLAADRRKWTKDLDRIVEGGLATVSGKGVKGDPKRYLQIPSQDSVPKAGTERTENRHSGGGFYSVLPFPIGKGRTEPPQNAGNRPAIPSSADSVPAGCSGDATVDDFADGFGARELSEEAWSAFEASHHVETLDLT